MRGAYYREESTRVVQPMLEFSKDLPAGFDVGGHTLVDAITSASIGQGVAQDRLFQERRYEGAIVAGKSWGHTRLGGFFRHSNEPDYVSNTVGLTFAHGVWENSGTLMVNLAAGHDDIQPKFQDPKKLDLVFGGVAYQQALSPVTIAEVGYEAFYLNGFQGNPYLSHPSLGRGRIPAVRLRHVVAARIARFVPALGVAAQLHYRFYLDQDSSLRAGPWGMVAHSVEGRVSKELGRDVEVRLSYRFHSQGGAGFYCKNPPNFLNDCYEMNALFHSVDEKFGGLSTHLPEVKLTWDLRVLRGRGFFDLFALGAVDISYGIFFQTSHYGGQWGGAHLLQTGYSLPF